MEINKEQYLESLKKKGEVNKKMDDPFQEICSELKPIFGDYVFAAIRKPGNNNEIFRKALRIWHQKKVGYFEWLLKNIKNGKIYEK